MVRTHQFAAVRVALLLAAIVTAASCGSSGGGGSSSDASADHRSGDQGEAGKKDAGFVSHDAGSDCGGRTGNPCGDGAKCTQPSDCQSDVCTNGVCVAPAPTCATHCGETGCPSCTTGQACTEGPMCASEVCAAAPVVSDGGGTDGGPVSCNGGSCKCQPPTPTDGVKNDSETGIDCGGALQEGGQPNPSSDHAPPCGTQQPCVIGFDCASLICAHSAVAALDGGVDAATVIGDGAPIDCASSGGCTCQSPSAHDGVKNDSETGIDCGGALLANGMANPASDGAPACTNAATCLLGNDCQSLVCYTGTITSATASTTNSPIDCPTGQTCTCIPPAPNDGVKNDSETGVDCGGGTSPGSDGAPACADGQACVLGTDCVDLVCAPGPLAAPSPGGAPVNCGMGQMCTCQKATHIDGIKNDSETDIDCGGGFLASGTANASSDGASPCADARACQLGTDCLSAYCSQISRTCVDGQSCSGLIQAAHIMDVVGCYGGAGNPPLVCPVGSCNMTTYDCVDAKGDVAGIPDPNGAGQNAGIDTCGYGEATDMMGQAHESCCQSLPLVVSTGCTAASCPAGEMCVNGSCEVRLDKYEVTTGRLRQFVEWVNLQETGTGYNLRAWVAAQIQAGTPFATLFLEEFAGSTALMNQMAALLPQSNDSGDALNIVQQLGGTTMDPGYPSDVQGCFLGDGAFGASTYWWNALDEQAVGSPPRSFTQDYYDVKPENCVPYWIAAAFCAWDGGRLPTLAEDRAAYGTATYPWGSTVPPHLFTGGGPAGGQTFLNAAEAAGDTITQYTVDWADGSPTSGAQGDFYFYPSFANSNPTISITDTLSNGLDLSVYIAAPGRFTNDRTTARTALGDNEGWQDFGANLMELMEWTTTLTSTDTFCDTTGTGGSPDLGVCSRSTPSGTMNGIIRATNMPVIEWEGGSWEGHGIAYHNATYTFPMQTQYGKAGFRCARPPE